MAKKKSSPKPEPINPARLAKLVEDLSGLLANPMARVDTLNDLTEILSNESYLGLDSEPPPDGATDEARQIVRASQSEGEATLLRLAEAVRWHVDDQNDDRIWSLSPPRGAYSTTRPTMEMHVSGQEFQAADQSRGNLSPDRDRTFNLWFGTNRKPEENSANGQASFTSDDDRRLHWGTCTVVVPASHQIGSSGTPWWLRTLTGVDKRPRPEGATRQDTNQALAELRRVFETLEPDERTATVFIHGFNVTFPEATRRAAQIGCDLNLPGVMALYSWPSRGTHAGYPADEATIEASEPFLKEFLIQVATESGASRVHIIAHSMGNRALLRVIQELVSSNSKASGPWFANVVLAAPDIDQRVFKNLGTTYPKVAQRTTLYASSRDLALRWSQFIHKHPRVGYTPPVTVVEGVDTIEVSGIDLSWLGHGYFATARPVLQHMHALLSRDEPPQKQFGFGSASGRDSEPSYWVIRK